MRLNTQRPHKSIALGAIDSVDVPMFMVLTGPNGSGKSNLLEAIQNNAVVYDDLGAIDQNQIRLFPLGHLLAAADGPQAPQSFREPWANLYNQFPNWLNQLPLAVPSGNDEQANEWLIGLIVGSRLATRSAMDRMLSEVKKPLSQFTVEDFRDHAPLISGVRDPFAASIGEVFLSYSQRRTQNQFAQWRVATKQEGSALTDQEFIDRFGPLPWDLFDETLKLVGLPYKFVPPPESDTAQYVVELEDNGGIRIVPDQLSSGERVLLAVAMSLFTGSRLTEAIELPRVLLLDEADASLHPSMVRSLLTVIQEIFVNQFQVRVILTTHSPSTVALAPEESLFVMGRSAPRLAKASTDAALQNLTVGLSTLSVKLENRRQVFVESEYDQSVFQELYKVAKPRLSSERSLEFIAVGRQDVGGGCDMVKRLVKELRNAGNDTVFGIVDRDDRKGSPDYVHYIADRYSIENAVFDPLLLGAFLIREKVVQAQDLGVPSTVRHYELNATHAGPIVAALSSRFDFHGSPVSCTYADGSSVAIPRDFLEKNGHDFEEVVVASFPPLNAFKKNLKRDVVKRAAGDVPDYIPGSVINLFEGLLAG